jgi:hypothetical protein
MKPRDSRSERERLSPSGLPWPPTWKRPRLNGRLRIIVSVGLGMLLVGMGTSEWVTPTLPSNQSGAGAFLLFGIGCLLTPLWFGIGRGQERISIGAVPGLPEKPPGTIFRIRPLAYPAMAACGAAFGGGTVLLAQSPDPGLSRPPAILLAVGAMILLVSPLPIFMSLGFRGFALSPDLVVLRTMRGKLVTAPWDEIGLPCPHEIANGFPNIKVPVGKTKKEVFIPAGLFHTDPALMLWVLRHYSLNPDDRHELGTQLALDRIADGRLDFRANPFEGLSSGEWWRDES